MSFLAWYTFIYSIFAIIVKAIAMVSSSKTQERVVHFTVLVMVIPVLLFLVFYLF